MIWIVFWWGTTLLHQDEWGSWWYWDNQSDVEMIDHPLQMYCHLDLPRG